MSKIPQTPTLPHTWHTGTRCSTLPGTRLATICPTMVLGPMLQPEAGLQDFTMFDFQRGSTKTTKYDHGMLA
jgi:hypothetical protein